MASWRVDLQIRKYANLGSHMKRAIELPEDLFVAASRSAGCGIPLPCIAEFWSIVTHPAAVPCPSRPDEVRAFLAALAEAGMTTLLPRASFGDRLRRLAQDLGVAANGILDLQIGLTALDAGATELWTHDRRFEGIPGLPAFDPIDG